MLDAKWTVQLGFGPLEVTFEVPRLLMTQRFIRYIPSLVLGGK